MLRDFIVYVCYWLRCEGILGHLNYHFRQPCDLGRLSLSWLHTFRFHCSCFRSLSLHKIRFSVGTTELIEVMNCDISCINELNELKGKFTITSRCTVIDFEVSCALPNKLVTPTRSLAHTTLLKENKRFQIVSRNVQWVCCRDHYCYPQLLSSLSTDARAIIDTWSRHHTSR